MLRTVQFLEEISLLCRYIMIWNVCIYVRVCTYVCRKRAIVLLLLCMGGYMEWKEWLKI